MKFIKKVLDNGMHIVLIPNNSPNVTMGLFVDAGSRNEFSSINGMAHFLEHMMFKSTKNRTPEELFNELDGDGITYNAATYINYTYYWFHGHKSSSLKMLDILLDIYLNPEFNISEINNERKVIVEEMRMHADVPITKIYLTVHEKLFKGTYLEHNVIGTEKIINELKRKDFIDFRKSLYTPERTVFVMVGGFNPDIIYRNLNKIMKDVPNAETDVRYLDYQNQFQIVNDAMKNQLEPYIFVKTNPTMHQSYTLLVFPLGETYDQHHLEYDLLALLLASGFSSRLFKALREDNGITYGISATTYFLDKQGFFTIQLIMTPSSFVKGIKLTLEQLIDIKEHLISNDEMDKIYNEAHGNITDLQHNQFNLLVETGLQMLLNRKHRPTIRPELEKLKAIKRKDLRNTAKRIFTREMLNIFIYGNINLTKNDYKNILSSF